MHNNEEHHHVTERHMPIRKGKNILIPIAIVSTGIAIATAVLIANGTTPFTKKDNLPDFGGSTTNVVLTPVMAEDHLLGNPNAPVVLVEYSDFNCPYCKSFHESMNQLMKEHGAAGNVAWVYRHFPVITEDSPKIAEASECVAELAGNDAFWKFAQAIFDRDQNTRVDMEKLLDKALAVGVDKSAYEECIASGRHVARLQALMENASKLDVGGTPHTFAIINGKTYTVEGGALPYARLTQELSRIVEQAKTR